MGFQQLLTKVQQAEATLQARERRVADDWQRLKTTWKDAWTPGRLIIAGLAAGFLIARAQPLRVVARSGQWMQLVTMISGLFAQVAQQQAEEGAEAVENAADTVATSADATSTAASPVTAES